jgi:hypothetical protein
VPLARVPPPVPRGGTSFPLQGSMERFPWLSGTMRYSDSLPPFAPRFVSFAWRYHPVRLCSSLPQARRRLEAWSFRVWQPLRHMLSRWKRQGLSGSWETFCVYALFLDPGRTSPPGHYGGSARPPHRPTARAPTMTQFRGSIAEPEHSLFTLRREHYCPRRKTRFRAPAKLSRAGLVTR